MRNQASGFGLPARHPFCQTVLVQPRLESLWLAVLLKPGPEAWCRTRDSRTFQQKTGGI